jgi:hypothetical protein
MELYIYSPHIPSCVIATLPFFWFDGNNKQTIGARHVKCSMAIGQKTHTEYDTLLSRQIQIWQQLRLLITSDNFDVYSPELKYDINTHVAL